MLTIDNYNKGIIANDKMKYSIVHDNAIMFKIVCASLADKLLNHEYGVDLTEEKIKLLQKIKNV